jgi:hypothetical protein
MMVELFTSTHYTSRLHTFYVLFISFCVAGRQGGGREMRDNECNSKTKQNKKMDLRNVK